MFKKFFAVLFALTICMSCMQVQAKRKEDARTQELKYQYKVMQKDAKKEKDKKIYNLTPSGYMTLDEYEALSEYKDKAQFDYQIPKVNTPSDFKYVPQPTYRIVKYNDPPGSPELMIGKQIYIKRQINAQGIVSPDFSMMVYPAVYYYTDSASIASDLFVIPLNDGDTNLNKIMKANIAKRIPKPIFSTDKSIDNYASFRSLTPVDFSTDGTKLLFKQKIGSREDGIWQTSIYVYDFVNKLDYDLFEIRDAIVYFWDEYMKLNLDEKRWDIYPLGFDVNEPYKILVQAYAYTDEKPIFLGTWSVDWKGNQSRLISFNKNYKPQVSSNGYKVVRDGTVPYDVVEKEEESLKEITKEMREENKKAKKEVLKLIDDEYKYTLKSLEMNYKDEYRDLKKLRSISGSTENPQLQEAYKKYLIDQLNKDIKKTEKEIQKKNKEIEKIDKGIEKLQEENYGPKKPVPTKDEVSGNSAQS